MSGELVSARKELGFGPAGNADPASPFTARQLLRLDEALTLSSLASGLKFSVYVGELANPSRGAAEQLFSKLTDDAVLLAVSPGARQLQIVTGPVSGARLSNHTCGLAALAMRGNFANGDLVSGLVNGLRLLSDAAGNA